jgi:hypothetical protein
MEIKITLGMVRMEIPGMVGHRPAETLLALRHGEVVTLKLIRPFLQRFLSPSFRLRTELHWEALAFRQQRP